MRGKHIDAFTMVELLAGIAILAALIATAGFFVASYINWSQKTANQTTLATLNNALQQYKTLGGMSKAHSLQGDNTITKLTAVIDTLKAGVTVYNQKKPFLNAGETHIDPNKLYADGEGKNFRFVGYGYTTDGTPTGSFAGSYVERPNPILITIRNNIGSYSTNGTEWHNFTLPHNADNWGITYGSNKFVAVGGSTASNQVLYSSDGIVWQTSSLPQATGWSGWGSVAYGNGLFSATSVYNGLFATSNDGITWQSYSGNNLGELVFDGSKFLSVLGSDYKTSTNGISWSYNSLPISVTNIAYLNGILVAPGVSSNSVAYSSNGTNWNTATIAGKSPTIAEWYAWACGDRIIILPNGGSTAFYSTDGANWHPITLPSSEYWMCAAYFSNRYIIVTGGKIAYSSDLSIWTTVNTNGGMTLAIKP